MVANGSFIDEDHDGIDDSLQGDYIPKNITDSDTDHDHGGEKYRTASEIEIDNSRCNATVLSVFFGFFQYQGFLKRESRHNSL